MSITCSSSKNTRGGWRTVAGPLALVVALAVPGSLLASSHREAPAITKYPQVDATDFYMFRSYEAGRDGFVTLIANYNPLQDPTSGPAYYPLDPMAFYDIHIINDGDETEDLTFRFRFIQPSSQIALEVGNPGETVSTGVPVVVMGPAAGNPSALNVQRSFTLRLIRGDLRAPAAVQFVTNTANGKQRFAMPFDNVGSATFPDYPAYSARHVYDIQIPGCGAGRVFVGQRQESFQGDLGSLFDLASFDVLGPTSGRTSTMVGKNVTSLALEVPSACLSEGNGAVVAGWTTARLPRYRELKERPTYDEPEIHSGDYVQVSRLGNPLVSELLIPFGAKDLFNHSHPRDDLEIVPYVTHPSLPEVLEGFLQPLGVVAPNLFPRDDLVVGFMTGDPNLNGSSTQGEVMRLNTTIAPLPADQQSSLGVTGGDLAGYPNGRRPGDDVVDISLRVLMGFALPASVAPSGQLLFTDGVAIDATRFGAAFPYLNPPYSGSD